MLLKLIRLLKKFHKSCICYKIKNELINLTSISLAFIFTHLREIFKIYCASRERKYLTIFDDTTGIPSIRAHNISYLVLFTQVLFTHLFENYLGALSHAAEQLACEIPSINLR